MGEALLVILVVLAAGWLTSLEPARQASVREASEAGLQVRARTQDLDARIQLTPGSAGPNALEVRLQDGRGKPVVGATEVRVTLIAPTADVAAVQRSAQAAGGNAYRIGDAPLGVAGRWQAEVYVARLGAFDARATASFQLPPAAPQPAPPSQDKDKAWTLFGIELALIGVVFVGAGMVMKRRTSLRPVLTVAAPGLCALIAGGAVALAQGGESSPEGNRFRPTSAALTTGKALYEQHCASCHGMNGAGDGINASKLRTSPGNFSAHVPYHSDRTLFRYIHDGFPATEMPAFAGTLTDDQIRHLVNYIKTLAPPASP